MGRNKTKLQSKGNIIQFGSRALNSFVGIEKKRTSLGFRLKLCVRDLDFRD
jgi:hypothetical protein